MKRKESKYTTMKNHQFTKEDSKTGRKEQRNYKTATKQSKDDVSPFLLIIILRVNGLNSPNKRHRVAERTVKKKNTQLYAAYKRFT